MKYFSTFSGIGGFELGIQRIFPRAECVGYSEYDTYPTKIYAHHFPTHKNYGDITKIEPSTLPDFDLLVWGSPCQSHSVVGTRKGFDDPRGQLFFDYVRLLSEKKPKAFVFENVKGLVTGKKWENLKIVLQSLSDAWYSTTYKVLKASDYGVPQDRERLFIVGIRNDIYNGGYRYKWQNNTQSEKTFLDILDAPQDVPNDAFITAKNLDKMSEKITTGGKTIERFEKGFNQDADRKYARTVVANICRGFPCDIIINRHACKYGFYTCEFCGNLDGVCDDCDEGDTYQEAVYGSPWARKYSLSELERLFGFPAGFSNVPWVCEWRKKKAFGNSVVVDVVASVMSGFVDLFTS